MTEQPERSVDSRTLIILAFSATAGVLVEFYDFTIFGFATASAFPEIFFPNLPPTRALVFSYLALGAGYPARRNHRVNSHQIQSTQARFSGTDPTKCPQLPSGP